MACGLRNLVQCAGAANGLHALGCAFAWPQAGPRGVLALVFVAHLAALGILWRRRYAANNPRSRWCDPQLRHAVAMRTLATAFVATVLTLAPSSTSGLLARPHPRLPACRTRQCCPGRIKVRLTAGGVNDADARPRQRTRPALPGAGPFQVRSPAHADTPPLPQTDRAGGRCTGLHTGAGVGAGDPCGCRRARRAVTVEQQTPCSFSNTASAAGAVSPKAALPAAAIPATTRPVPRSGLPGRGRQRIEERQGLESSTPRHRAMISRCTD